MDHKITNYSPFLSGVALLTPDTIQCDASVAMEWFLPGVPSLTLHANSIAQARMSI